MTVQKIGKIIALVGAILVFGALGAADCGTVSFARICVALVFRISITLVVLYLCCFVDPDEYIDEIEVD